MYVKSIAFVLCLILFGAFQEKKSYTVEDVPDPKRSGGGYVSNPDNIINKESVSVLNASLSRIVNAGQAQIAVVVLESIGDKVPKDFAVALFNLWGLGDKDKDNGLLILIVNDQHRIEFETGYGLEAVLTDAMCKKIQMDQMIPYAKQGNLDQALSYGISAVEEKLSNPEAVLVKDSTVEETADVTIEEAPYEPPAWNLVGEVFSNLYGFFVFSGLSWLCLVIAYSLKKKGEKKKFSFKNTVLLALVLIAMIAIPIAIIGILNKFFGITDFPFYVIIAIFYFTWCLFVHLHYFVLSPIRNRSKVVTGSRFEQYTILSEANQNVKWFSWIFPLPFMLIYRFINQAKMKKLRDEPYICECGNAMVKLDETMDDEHLDKGQITEEQINSVDYDVWVCNSCQKQLIFKYENFSSGAEECKSCHAKTLQQTTKEVVELATYSSSGYGYNHFACKNCGHTDKERYTIPMKEHSSSSSSGSSSSSSSWGGGSSGGGGSGSSW
jgi:uncharacterized protein